MNTLFQNLSHPIVGLSPMDGITDPAFRYVTDVIGKPHLLFTEFISADGLARSAVPLLSTCVCHQSKTPVIAQLFGHNPESVYRAARILMVVGFDGIDINMGCPNRRVMHAGGGAKLIGDFKRAEVLIRAMNDARRDYENGMHLDDIPMSRTFVDKLNYITRARQKARRVALSVKTRILDTQSQTNTWVRMLCSQPIDAITVHVRPVVQLHNGPVHYEQLLEALDSFPRSNFVVLGNGGVHDIHHAIDICKTYKLDGVLVGQASFGCPWVFTNHTPTLKERINAMQMHIQAHETLTPGKNPLLLRKHLAWYVRGLACAAQMRTNIMKCETVNDFRSFVGALT